MPAATDVVIESLARPVLQGFRPKAAAVGLNLLLFIGVTSLPAFQAAHHHWIFPVMAVMVAAQWAGTFALPREEAAADARAALVSILTFLLSMGIVRHATILTCFDRCAFKLAEAAALAAPVFFLQGRLRERGFWSATRCTLAALGCLAWAAYLALRGAQVAPWAIDAALVVVALLFWLGRDSAAFLVASAGVLTALFIRAAAGELTVIALGVGWGVALPLAAAPRVEAWLEARKRARAAAPPPPTKSRRRLLLESAGRIVAAVATVAGGAAFLCGPIRTMAEPEKRQHYLAALAPAVPVSDVKTLSPLAARLRDHVAYLSTVERDTAHRDGMLRARDYVARQLRAEGYAPRLLPYDSQWLAGQKNGTQYWNVEAALGSTPSDRARPWVVGAHYDTAPGTPGADDNASGTAVLIEAARLLREERPNPDVRFVAFGTEEPPAFGTRNMGSWRYAKALQESGAPIRGMISLEMLGYFNPKKGAQLYPPFMHLFYPDDGDFVGIVSDWRSRALAARFSSAWRAGSTFPLTVALLPGPLSSLALSDQLNFWDRNFPALMLSDTAFYRNPNYHEAGDKPETLDYEKMARVTRALAKTLAEKP